MTSYLHHSTISRRKRFSESLVKIRHDDVTWRHMTSFSRFFTKNCWKSAEKLLTSAKKINYVSFFSKSIIISFISGVNHFLTISGSQIIVISISDIKMPIFDDVIGKMLTSAKNCWRMHTNFYAEFFVTKCTWSIPIFMITVYPIQKLRGPSTPKSPRGW